MIILDCALRFNNCPV